ncbi:MAG: DUF1295 domain-containing protein [Anaerolineae bacterium]|nr:DUF1295 domain-containing protein [Anaerolineae bacterium]
MKKESIKSIFAVLVVVLIGFGLALAGSQNSIQIENLPAFGVMIAIIFLIQWIVFIPAFIYQTEKFYDLTGSITYTLTIIAAIVIGGKTDLRSILLTAMVVVWAARLGSFLVRRVHAAGKDDRFDAIKPDFFRFLLAWTLQALWVSFTLSAALAALTSDTSKPAIDIFLVVGFLVWLFGFLFEVVSDQQKSKFRKDPANKGRFISTGLWALSRHPNYFGEIVLWLGVAIITMPVLSGWQWVTMISPVFVTLLLTKISGVPLLEKKADAKWGGQPDYEKYKRSTPVLIPRLGKAKWEQAK